MSRLYLHSVLAQVAVLLNESHWIAVALVLIHQCCCVAEITQTNEQL